MDTQISAAGIDYIQGHSQLSNSHNTIQGPQPPVPVAICISESHRGNANGPDSGRVETGEDGEDSEDGEDTEGGEEQSPDNPDLEAADLYIHVILSDNGSTKK